MSMIAVLAAAAVAAKPPPTIPLPGLLAPMGTGKLMCIGPDKAKKTCIGIGGMRLNAKGEMVVWNKTWLGDARGPLLATQEAVVTLKDGAVCDPNRPSDFEATRYTWAGGKLTAQQVDVLRTRIKARLQQYFNRETCQQVYEDAGGLVMLARVNGVQDPSLTLRFVWISPKDGYRVGV